MAACAREMILPAFARPAAASSATTVQQKTQPISLNAPPKPRVLTRIKSGLASWYGEVLQNHLTASGRRFDKNELTAAHRTLPFGSKVKVTDLRSHRSVVVTITDRGVLAEDRVIDLSLAAAKELQMVKMGVDPVKLELVSF
jgi:rare lipoprotein A